MATVGILITGSEVLFGKTRDTNGPFLARSLRLHGHKVVRTICCGDSDEAIFRSLACLAEECEVVIVTGGLGPTCDDMTSAVVARFLGLPLLHSEEAWGVCLAAFERLGRREIPESNRKQALVPEGARVLANPFGTAAGWDVLGSVDSRTVRVVALPGVPQEMKPMFDAEVLPNLGNSQAHLYDQWNVFLIGESAVQQALVSVEGEISADFPSCEISYQAHQGYVSWGVAQTASAEENRDLALYLDERVDPLMRELFAHHLIFRGTDSLAEFVVRRFGELRLRLALAESCTGGLVAREITAVPNASLSFLGAAVTYSNESKVDLLGVDFLTLERYGAVSPETAHQMAHGARLSFSSDVAISVTGVAGPTGGTPRHPVGLVCFGISIVAQRLRQEEAFLARMAELGWRRSPGDAFQEPVPGRRLVELVSERRFGQGVGREVIQSRSVVYCLGTLAAMVAFF